MKSSHRGPRRRSSLLFSRFFFAEPQKSHHLCTRRYSPHRARLAVKMLGGLTCVMFYVRVEFLSLHCALNSRNPGSSRQGEARLQLLFWPNFLLPTANFTCLGAVQEVREITRYFGTV